MVKILYRKNTEYERGVELFRDLLEKHYDVKADMVDADSKDGSSLAKLYDIMQFPAVLAIRDDGQLIQSWTKEIPLASEVSYYVHQPI